MYQERGSKAHIQVLDEKDSVKCWSSIFLHIVRRYGRGLLQAYRSTIESQA